MPATTVNAVNVATSAQMEQVVMSYVAQGFAVSTQTADTTTLFKKKEFNIIWAIIGFFLCVIPLLIYCIVYAQQSDQMVVIRLDPAAAQLSGVNAPQLPVTMITALTWSEDRRYWWDGGTWIDANKTVPPGAAVSDDGQLWWDGNAWRPTPAPPAPSDTGAGKQDADPSAEAGESSA